jgi:hypothetical protein
MKNAWFPQLSLYSSYDFSRTESNTRRAVCLRYDSGLDRDGPELQPPAAVGAEVLRDAPADEVLLSFRKPNHGAGSSGGVPEAEAARRRHRCSRDGDRRRRRRANSRADASRGRGQGKIDLSARGQKREYTAEVAGAGRRHRCSQCWR